MNDIIDALEDFYYDHQRGIIASIIIVIGILIAYIVFLIIYNPIKIKFDGEDYKILATKPTELVYKAIAYDKNTTDYPIKWEVSDGNLSSNEGSEVRWELPSNAGTYTISAISGNKVLTNSVTVLENILVDSLEDVEVISSDTDMDGLTDEYEENVSRTDPKNADTDGDGMMDGDEVLLGLDPTLASTKSDDLNDSERELKYKFTDKETNVTIQIVGSGNLTKTTVDAYETDSLQKLNEMASPLYYIFSNAKIKSMDVKIKYNKETLAKRGLKEDSLSIYKLDEGANKFIKLDSNLNKEDSSISTQIKENCKLFIADSSTMKSRLTTELMFVIDNSGSMYSKEQIAESNENDVNFKRLTTANKMIDKLKGDYKFGAGKFTFDYTNLAELTTDKEYVKSKIDSVKNSTERFTGTYIGEALSSGLKQFPDENKTGARRYMILLTDGKDTENVSGYDRDRTKNAIEEAKKKGVKVYTIGLGKEIDKEVLKNIATQTSGKFFYALNADILDNLFEVIAAQMNYDFIDNNNDHVDDSILLADSEFITKRDGLSFDNVPLKEDLNGCTYGMSLLSKLYFEGILPRSLSQMTVKVANSDKVVKAKGFESNDMRLEGSMYENSIEKLEFLSDSPKDLRAGGLEKSVLRLKNDYKVALTAAGFETYTQAYKKSKSKFNNYENYILDMQSDKYINGMSDIGKGFFEAIARLDILKYRDETISFKNESDKAMRYLKQTLLQSKPCLLKLNDTYTVSATKLIEDNSNPNKFRIEVYDPNVSGVIRYVECIRSVVSSFKTEDGASKEIVKNYIYGFTYNNKPVDVKVSIPNVDANV